jgi:glycine betaine/proline transport system ATP-binding protein
VGEVADRIEAADAPFAVLDDDGAVIGHINRRTVIDILIGRPLVRHEDPR